jgi:tRNA A-37 threonylcarbamoyl transferase component Bud32
VYNIIRNYNIIEVKREICIQNICSQHNLCKPVIDWWLVQNGGVIISPVMEETIYQKLNRINNTLYLKSQKYGEKKITTIIKNVWKLVFKLHELGIYHGDCHQGNIMTDENDTMYFIDMGLSKFTLELPGGKNTEKRKDAVMDKYIIDYANSATFLDETKVENITAILFDKIQVYLDNGENYYDAERKTINEMLNMSDKDFYNMLLENKIVIN